MPTLTGKPGQEVREVIVTSAGVRNHVPHQQNMTVRGAADEAKVAIPFRSKLFVNNQPADKNTRCQPGDVVTVAPRAKNGA